MKRIFICMLCAFLIALPIVGCNQKSNNTIRLNEVTHSIFYAPQYVAMEKGYFEDEGLDIELFNGQGANNSMTALLSNQADIGLMGPEAAIYVYLEGKSDYVKVFGQLTKRDGSFLVSKTDIQNFDWTGLDGKSVIGGRPGGVPAMTLEWLFNQKGYTDGENINFNMSVDFANTAGAFIGGDDDFVALFEPTASDLQRNGKGYIVASVGKDAGEVPYTAYMAKQSYIENNPKLVEKFLKAIYKGMKYMQTASIDELVEILKPHFVGFAEVDIKDSIQSYLEIDAYMSNPIMTEASFDRLQDIMDNAGYLDERVPFDKLIDNSIAQKVVNQLG